MIARTHIPFTPYEHQRILFDHTPVDDEILTLGLFTGYNGGKTFSAVAAAMKVAVPNFPIPFLCIEPTYQMCVDVLLPAFEEFLTQKMGLKEGRHYHYNKSSHNLYIHYKHKGGARIRAFFMLRSSDNPKSLVGKQVCGTLIDEPFLQDQEAYNQALARTRKTKTGKRVVLLSGTPEGLNWGEEVIAEACSLVSTVQIDVKGSLVDVKRFESPDRKIRYIQSSSELNRSMPSDYIESMLAVHTEEQVRAYIYGEFVNMKAGRCYYNYDGNIHLRKFELQQAPIDVSVDFNAGEKPMSWNVSQDFGDSTLVRFALQRKNTNTLAMCQYLWDVLRGYFKQGVPPITIYGDYTGNARNSSSDYTDYQIIRQFFVGKVPLVVKVQPNPKIIRRVNLVNARLKNAKGDIHLFLHTDDTKPLQKDFEHCTWDSTGKEDQSNPMLSHSSSALGYMLAQKHPIERTRSIAA